MDFENLYSGKSGQFDFYDIAEKMESQFECITNKNEKALDYDIYTAKGDSNAKNYISPDNFDETAVCITAEKIQETR